MSKINFFTAVKYENRAQDCHQSFVEKVDDYFFLCGKKGLVLQGATKNGKEVVLTQVRSSRLAQIAKVITYFTIFIPFLLIIAKVILRLTHTFRLINPNEKKLQASTLIQFPTHSFGLNQELVDDVQVSKPIPIAPPVTITPSVAVLSKIAHVEPKVITTIFDPNDPCFVGDARINELISKVENKVGRCNVLDYKAFDLSSAKVKIANCIYGQDVTVAADRTLTLNGEPTDIKLDEQNLFILAFELHGNKYFYCLPEKEQLSDSNTIIHFARGQKTGVRVQANQILSTIFKVAPSASLKPDDPRVLCDTYLQGIKAKVETLYPPLKILSFETFDSNGAKIKIANCVPGLSIQIDEQNKLLVDGEDYLGSITEDGYCFVYQDKDKIYMYFQKDSEALNGKNKFVILSNNMEDWEDYTANEHFFSPASSRQVDLQEVHANPHIMSIKQRVEKATPPLTPLSYEIFNAQNINSTIVNCVSGCVVQMDSENNLFVDGRYYIGDNNTDACYFVFEYDDKICIYIKNDRTTLNEDNDDFCIIDNSVEELVKAKDFFCSPGKIAHCTKLDPTEIVNNTDLMEMKSRVEEMTFPLEIVSYQLYDSHGIESTVANCTKYRFEFDEKRNLILNGATCFSDNRASANYLIYDDPASVYVYVRECSDVLGFKDRVYEFEKQIGIDGMH